MRYRDSYIPRTGVSHHMNAPQQVISVSTGYEPRPLQAAIHREMTRFSVLAIHRRFGETVLALK